MASHVCLIACTCSCSARHCGLSLISAAMPPAKGFAVQVSLVSGLAIHWLAGPVWGWTTRQKDDPGQGWEEEARQVMPRGRHHRWWPPACTACPPTPSRANWMDITEAVLHQRNADLYSKNSWSDRGEWYRSEGIAWAWDGRAFSHTSQRYVQLAASPQASPAAIQRLGAAAEPGHWGSVHQPPATCLWERGLLPARPQQQRRESSAEQATAVAPAWV